MINDPTVQRQMERMRTSQAEADAAAGMAARGGGSQSGAEGFANGFNRFFDASKFNMPSAANPAQGIQAKAGEGMTLAASSGAPSVAAGSGGLGMVAPNTPFGQGIGAGIQAGLSGSDAQTAVNYGLGGQPAKKLW